MDSGAGVHRFTLDYKQLSQQPHLPQCGQHSVRKLLPRAVGCGWAGLPAASRRSGTHVRVTKGQPIADRSQVPSSSCTTTVTDDDGRETPCPRVQPAGRPHEADAGVPGRQTAAAASGAGGCCWAKRSEPALRRRRGARTQSNGKASVSPSSRRRFVQGHVRPTDYTCKRRGDRRRRRRLRRPLRSIRELLSLLLTGTGLLLYFIIC